MDCQENVVYLNTFDLLAEWIKHLSELDPSAYKSKDIRESTNLPLDLYAVVTQLFVDYPCLDDGEALVIYGIPERTVEEIRAWSKYHSFIYMFEFVVRLARKLRVDTIISWLRETKKEGFEALNNNVKQTGIQIIPKVKTIDDPLEPAEDGDVEQGNNSDKTKGDNKKHWATDRLAGINQDLSNVYYIETEDLIVKGESFSVRHHIVEEDFFLENKGDVLIGVSPISQGDFLDVDYETRATLAETRNYFTVPGIKDGDVVRKRLSAAIIEACERKVNILMFPEMLGCRETTQQSFVDSVADLALDKNLPMPSLILLPTWWHDYSNELYVFDGSGNCVCTQKKQYPFLLKDKKAAKSYLEDLRFDERVVHVVHVPKLGRLTFPICRDYLESEYLLKLTSVLRSTFLFCPSFSDKSTQFHLSAPSEVKYGCYTVWGNTCAASNSEGCPAYVGLVSGPTKEAECIKHLKPKCGGVCGEETATCLFLIRISMDHSAKISCEHIHG